MHGLAGIGLLVSVPGLPGLYIRLSHNSDVLGLIGFILAVIGTALAVDGYAALCFSGAARSGHRQYYWGGVVRPGVRLAWLCPLGRQRQRHRCSSQGQIRFVIKEKSVKPVTTYVIDKLLLKYARKQLQTIISPRRG